MKAEWLRVTDRIGWPLTVRIMRILRVKYVEEIDLRPHLIDAFQTILENRQAQ
jgi:hypothetical protein